MGTECGLALGDMGTPVGVLSRGALRSDFWVLASTLLPCRLDKGRGRKSQPHWESPGLATLRASLLSVAAFPQAWGWQLPGRHPLYTQWDSQGLVLGEGQDRETLLFSESPADGEIGQGGLSQL